MWEAFTVSLGISWTQLVTARCLVLIVGFNGHWACGTLSIFVGFHSISARTVRSCFDVVAKAISKVPAERICQQRLHETS